MSWGRFDDDEFDEDGLKLHLKLVGEAKKIGFIHELVHT